MEEEEKNKNQTQSEEEILNNTEAAESAVCLLYTSPSPRD